jgi:TerC family integral membrane protein
LTDVQPWLWAVTVALVLALIGFELVQATVRPHPIELRSAALQSAAYIGIALAFGLLVLWASGGARAGEYVTGWLVEKSLSLDNLFVFVILIQTFAVPAAYQPKVLIAGIAGALVLRTGFIAIGAAALEAFSVTYLLFGAFLLYTAVGLFRHRDQDPDPASGRLLRAIRRRLPVTPAYHGGRLTARVGGRRLATPLLLAMAAIVSTDILFALDSIPAVFGVTDSPFIVFAANAFALLGLRALYFLLAGLLDRLVYLSTGLSAILAFVGAKLVLEWGHHVNDAVPEIPTLASLGFILLALAITAAASLWRLRRDPGARGHAGDPYRRRARPRNAGTGGLQG